jgi:prefoldin subunit 5
MSAPPPVVEHGTGLVVMLDAAGRTIATLEQRVEQLTAALLAERQERQRLTELLEELRQGANTTDVPHDTPGGAENGDHDRPAPPT